MTKNREQRGNEEAGPYRRLTAHPRLCSARHVSRHSSVIHVPSGHQGWLKPSWTIPFVRWRLRAAKVNGMGTVWGREWRLSALCLTVSSRFTLSFSPIPPPFTPPLRGPATPGERRWNGDGTVRVRHRKSREADKTLVFATLVMFHLSPTRLTVSFCHSRRSARFPATVASRKRRHEEGPFLPAARRERRWSES